MSLRQHLSKADSWQAMSANTPFADSVADLPPLTPPDWQRIKQFAQSHWLQDPRRVWYLLRIAQENAIRGQNLALEADISFQLARASNLWAEPSRIQAAVTRAHRCYTQLNQPHWIAACEWQRYANPWLSPDFNQAYETLSRALPIIEAHPDTKPYTDAVHYSLAYAEILLSRYSDATRRVKQLLMDSPSSSLVRQGQTHFSLAACLRRQQDYLEAYDQAMRAKKCFVEANAPIFIYRSHVQLGFTVQQATSQYAEAKRHFETAVTWFQAKGITTWENQAKHGLADVSRQMGHYREAEQYLREIARYNREQGIHGNLADNLLDLSYVSNELGKYDASLAQAQEAYELNEELQGYRPTTIRALSKIGSAHAYGGEYHQALQSLETAFMQASTLAEQTPDQIKLVAEIGNELARLWLWLGQTQKAQAYLETGDGLSMHQLPLADWLDLQISRAELLLVLNRPDELEETLHASLVYARQQNLLHSQAEIEHLLGRSNLLRGGFPKSQKYLLASQQSFRQMGMWRAELDVQISLVRLFQANGETEKALRLIYSVLDEADKFPRLRWEAQALLAELTQEVEAYEQALNTLNQIRHRLQKPSLNGPFLSFADVSLFFQQGVNRAYMEADENRLWTLIEGSKYKLLTRTAGTSSREDRNQLGSADALRYQIDAITRRIAQTRSLRRQRELYIEYKKLSQQYDQWQDQQERAQYISSVAGVPLIPQVTPEKFRQYANRAWDYNWVALNYFLTKETLFISSLTPSIVNCIAVPFTADVAHTLNRLSDPDNLTATEWQALSNFLLPATLRELLTTGTILIIAPHNVLHHVPWSALRIKDEALIEHAIPLIAPSLSILLQLPTTTYPLDKPSKRQLLVVGVSRFAEQRHMTLPQVREELQIFSTPNVTRLMDKEATWSNVYQRMVTNRAFDAWHLATHVFFDPTTNGRMSGFALYDRDIWIENITTLPYMPQFIFLSGCSSLATHVYAGDEQTSLALTLLGNGAKTVVGSLWPVVDEAARSLAASFYKQWQKQTKAVVALAQAQRLASRAGYPLSHWAGFRLIGAGYEHPPLPAEEPPPD